MFERWLKFNSVGLVGVGVNLGVLALLTHSLGWNYLVASLVAVEAAVLHNFVWHCRWTWKDRASTASRLMASRLMRFHVSNGLVSMLGSLLLMPFLVGLLHLPVVVAGFVSIGACSIANFLLSDRFVFRC